MARGLFSGLIWGGLVAIGGAAILSLTTPLPQPPEVSSANPDVANPAAEGDAVARPAGGGSVENTTQPDPQPAGPGAPETDTLAALDGADTAPATVPSVGTAAPLADNAVGETSVPEVSTTMTTAPAAPSAPAAGLSTPSAPQPGGDLSISTEPAQPSVPATGEESGFAPLAESEEPAAATTATVEPEQAPDTAVSAEPSPAPQADSEPQPATETETAPRIAALPRVETAQDPAASEEPAPAIGQRVVPLTERDQDSSALPSVGATPAATAEASEEEAPVGQAEDLPPIARFAVPFDNAGAKPLMGIVLIDDAASIGVEALSSFPYPLTFAVDVTDPDAAAKMARHRAAGFEVLAMFDLPVDGSAQDAETALSAGLSVVSEAIGVLEGIGTGIRGNRGLSDQVTAVLRDEGYGLITQNAGLNTVQKLALRDGVPSAFVFRDFDGSGQSPTVMRRFLDQAAFRAGQEGGVIMLGRVRPDTISALLLWGLQDRASRVALAPASAVLIAQTPEQ